jgi:hypothetical protein
MTGADRPAAPNEPATVTPFTAKPGNGLDGGTDPQWEERSATEYGNSVTVRCEGTVARIMAYTAADGWSVTRVNPGPSDQVNIKFESATVAPNRVIFKSRCKNGVPRINPDVASP